MDNNPINLNDVLGDIAEGRDPVKHTVKNNENLEGIVTKYGVSVDHLRRQNNLDPADDRKLSINKILDIPSVKDVAKYNAQDNVAKETSNKKGCTSKINNRRLWLFMDDPFV